MVVIYLPKRSRTGHFAGTEAPGADIDVGGGTVNDRLDTLDVGFPGAIGAAVGMGHLDAKGHAFTAIAALCHFAYLLLSLLIY